MTNSNGSPQSGIGAIEPEAPQVRVGSGMGGHISCTEGLLWISRHPDRIGRGALARYRTLPGNSSSAQSSGTITRR